MASREKRQIKRERWGQMALVKRGKTWHTHFFVDGVRYRQSLETTDWREAQKREKELIAQATQGRLSASHQDFTKLSFSEAAKEKREAATGQTV
jgi:hypothetical protein